MLHKSVGLRFRWTSFFDDFLLLSKKSLSESAEVSAEKPLFPLLGLQLATDRRKAVAWSTRVKTLDVLIDLEPEGGDGHREVAWRAKSGNKAHRTL